MSLSKNKQIKTLKTLAEENNFTTSFLNEKIKQGILKFEKKGNTFYSTQEWLDEYRTNFTFSGFMLNRVFGSGASVENFSSSIATKMNIVSNGKVKEVGRIIQEKESKIDLEEIFVKKWNNEFKKIHNNFKDQIAANESLKKSKKYYSTKNQNVHITIISLAIIFVISLYAVILLPGASSAFTKKMDSFIKAPHEKLNQLALKTMADKNISSDNKNISSKDLALYIKENASRLSYPSGSSVDVRGEEILGRVAGIDETFDKTEDGFFQKIKKGSVEMFQKVSEKQKKASLKLSDELNKLISE